MLAVALSITIAYQNGRVFLSLLPIYVDNNLSVLSLMILLNLSLHFSALSLLNVANTSA